MDHARRTKLDHDPVDPLNHGPRTTLTIGSVDHARRTESSHGPMDHARRTKLDHGPVDHAGTRVCGPSPPRQPDHDRPVDFPDERFIREGELAADLYRVAAGSGVADDEPDRRSLRSRHRLSTIDTMISCGIIASDASPNGKVQINGRDAVRATVDASTWCRRRPRLPGRR
jgi:hypothetical protein